MDGLRGVDGALRIGADNEQVGLSLLEEAGRAGDRPARAHREHERVELAAGLLPDLRARCLVVGLRIRGIGVLVGLVRAGDLLREPRRDGVVALRRLGRHRRRADDDLGPEGAQQGDLLLRDLVGHHEDAAVALQRGGDREADARVAARRLDDRPSGGELPLLLGALDHPEADPVLDAAARVHELELGEEQRARRSRRGAGA